MEFQRKENKSKKKLKLVSVPLRGYRIPNNPASFIASSKDIKFPSPDGAIEFQIKQQAKQEGADMSFCPLTGL